MTSYEYETQNLVCEWVDFSKFSQIWLKFRKILEKSGNFGQNFVQNQAHWYMYITGSLFLEKIMGPLSNFLQHIPARPQPNLSMVPPSQNCSFL